MKTNKSRPLAASPCVPLQRRAGHFAVLLATAVICALSAGAASGTDRQTTSDGSSDDQAIPQPRSATPTGTAGSLPSAQFEGSLDIVNVVSLDGWAWDAAQPNVAIKVDVYDGTRLLATITAGQFREDLKSAGKGDGKHAFNYALPQTLRDGQAHTISVRFAGSPTELPGSPKTLLFPKP